MDRRWFGILLVACAVLAGVVAPNVSARRVAGSPVPVAVDGPPAAGMCVLAMTDPWGSNPAPGFAVGRTIAFPTARFGPCNPAAVGEVALVDAVAAPPEQIVDTDYQIKVSQCSLDAIGYLGSIPPLIDRGAGRPGLIWSSVLAFRYTTIGPTAVQRAAGQRWSACAVGSTDLRPYPGRLRDVLVTGVLPPVFGSCWRSTDLQAPAEIACDLPHAVELLGWAVLGATPVTAAEVRKACAAYAGRALRTADPTRNGAIRPEVLAYDQAAGTVPADGADLQDSFVACVLIAEQDRHFTNTLIGIGQRPVPLA